MDRLRLRDLLLDDSNILFKADFDKAVKDLEVSGNGSTLTGGGHLGENGVCGDEEAFSTSSIIPFFPGQGGKDGPTGGDSDLVVVHEPYVRVGVGGNGGDTRVSEGKDSVECIPCCIGLTIEINGYG